MLTGPRLGDIHHHPRQWQSLPGKILDFKPHPLLVAVRIAPRYGPPAGRMGIVPVLHIVLFRQPTRPGIPDVVLAKEFFPLGWGFSVDHIPPPHLGLVWPPGMPDGD